MQAIYGHLWSSRYRDENAVRVAQLEWLAAIRAKDYTLREIGAALDYCARSEPDMPNLPRFLEIVRAQRYHIRQREQFQAGGQLALPESPEQREAREAAAKAQRIADRDANLERLKQIQEMLG
jgi:hypothetical protein